jgi:hypothetical protein
MAIKRIKIRRGSSLIFLTVNLNLNIGKTAIDRSNPMSIDNKGENLPNGNSATADKDVIVMIKTVKSNKFRVLNFIASIYIDYMMAV